MSTRHSYVQQIVLHSKTLMDVHSIVHHLFPRRLWESAEILWFYKMALINRFLVMCIDRYPWEVSTCQEILDHVERISPPTLRQCKIFLRIWALFVNFSPVPDRRLRPILGDPIVHQADSHVLQITSFEDRRQQPESVYIYISCLLIERSKQTYEVATSCRIARTTGQPSRGWSQIPYCTSNHAVALRQSSQVFWNVPRDVIDAWSRMSRPPLHGEIQIRMAPITRPAGTCVHQIFIEIIFYFQGLSRTGPPSCHWPCQVLS